MGNSPDKIEHGCYCGECRRSYREFSGEELVIDDGVIEKKQRAPLGEWKRRVIENTVRSLNDIAGEAAKRTPIYIKTIPWTASELDQGLHWIAGQDTGGLGKLSDGVLPMAFTQILGQTPGWKKRLLDHVEAATGRKVMSYVQCGPLIRPTSISTRQLEEEIRAAIDEGRSGLVYFHYEQVICNAEKRKIMRKYREY